MSEINPAAREKVRIREVMNSPVITGTEKETVVEIAKRMIDCKVGSVVIMKNHAAVGVVTDGDIVSKLVSKNKKPSEVLAKDVMSSPLVTIGDDEEVNDAARLMRKKGVKRLGVTDHGKLMGMVSMSDIVAVNPEIYAVIAEKARILASQSMGLTKHLTGICDECEQWSDDLTRVENKNICYDCNTEETTETIIDDES